MNENTVGLKIKELRSKKSLELGRKYTGAMLANDLGISRSYLGDIESGRIIPNEALLGKIADIFDTDIYELIGNNSNIEIGIIESKIINRSKKVDDAIRKIDSNITIKTYLKNTDLNTLFYEILCLNDTHSLSTWRKNVDEISRIEESIFDEIYRIDRNSPSRESTHFKNKYAEDFYNRLINKLISLIAYEIVDTTDELERKTKNVRMDFSQLSLYPIAAHNDDNSKEQQTLMMEDIEEL